MPTPTFNIKGLQIVSDIRRLSTIYYMGPTKQIQKLHFILTKQYTKSYLVGKIFYPD